MTVTVADDATGSLAGFDATAPAAQASPVGPPTEVGPYRILDRIGEGGMGIVYRAHDPRLQRDLAIKLVRPRGGDADARARLLREAQAMARLHHPHVVPVFDVGAVDDLVFVVMPYLPGGTLRGWTRATPRPWREVIARYLAAARGLAAAHAAGMVHRDFKPENVLIGAGGEVQVADFGLARIDHDDDPPAGDDANDGLPPSGLTRTGHVLGTPAYMAPEQMRGERSDARSDQFSFCVALWEAIYRVRPFDPGDSRGAELLTTLLAAMEANRTSPLPRSDAPGWLRPLLLRGLRADPAERWPTLQHLIDAITEKQGRRRAITVSSAASALVVLALAATVVALVPRQRPAASTRGGVRVHGVTQRGDIELVALGPDHRLAMVANGQLLVRGLATEASERVLVRDGVYADQLAWSPDGTRLLVTLYTPDGLALHLVDVTTGEITALPFQGSGASAFLTTTEIAVASTAGKLIQRHDLTTGRPSGKPCRIPGSFLWVTALVVASGRTMVVTVTEVDEQLSHIVIGADCQRRATIRGDARSSIVVTDRDTLLLHRTSDGLGEITELTLDGTVLGSPQQISGSLRALLGRIDGRDYFLDVQHQTSLERRRPGGQSEVSFSTDSRAEFALAPDLETLAWIEGRNTNELSAGPLRITSLAELGTRGTPVMTDVLHASWSPDGRSLAVIRRIGSRVDVVVLDPATGRITPLAFPESSAHQSPVWINDHRLAVATVDHSTFTWIDLVSGGQGQLTSPDAGWVFDPCRTSRPDTLAMLWNRGRGSELFTLAIGGVPSPVAVATEVNQGLHCLRDDALLLFDVTNGVIDRVALATGERTRVDRRPLAPTEAMADVAVLGDGELLITTVRSVANVVVVLPD